jgi:hypothetical protein
LLGAAILGQIHLTGQVFAHNLRGVLQDRVGSPIAVEALAVPRDPGMPSQKSDN